MKVLVCHNYYQQPGGEDQSFDDEARLLESRGHDVVRFTMHNDAIRDMSLWQAARRTFWNSQAAAELTDIIRRERPAIAHFTNTFPLISPAAYYAARREGVKTIQSLRNYRLLCPNACFLRDGKVCEACLGKRVPWPAVRFGCYRNDRKATAVLSGMLAFHRAMGTWSRLVDLYYALTEFSRQKFVQGGLPEHKVAVKPNFMFRDPGPGDGQGAYALFVGRLAPEKGIDTLLAAWRNPGITTPLKIVGDGPLAESVRQAAGMDSRIEWLGHHPPDRVLALMGSAACVVLPSLWYEGLPKTIVESFAKGTPVVASNLGSMAELIEDGTTGLLFPPGDAAALSACVQNLAADPQGRRRMRQAARDEFARKFTAEANYELLLGLYNRVLGEARDTHEPVCGASTPSA
jgi:glycosyltransferase involved in cell wall biosynthesis